MTFWNCVNVGMPTRISSDAVTLSVAPLFHTAGLNLFANPCFHAGASVLVMRSFDPGQALDLISDATIGITHFWGVPAHYLFMMQHERFATADFSRLVCACVGGAPAPLSLAELENALYELAGVAEAAVIGIPNERLGEVGKAFVVPQVGAELTAAAVLEHCRKRLAKFKMPADVVFIDKLPPTTSGKVLKRELKPQ